MAGTAKAVSVIMRIEPWRRSAESAAPGHLPTSHTRSGLKNTAKNWRRDLTLVSTDVRPQVNFITVDCVSIIDCPVAWAVRKVIVFEEECTG
jgi:hypothetical protein